MSVRHYKAAFLARKGRGRPPKARLPKTLFLDIETAPIMARVWQLWKVNVGLNQIADDWFILSFSAKWSGDSRVMYFDQSKAKNIEDDTALLARLWKLLDEADIIVAHNGKKFDMKKINARLIKNGFGPPSPYQIVDTLLMAKDKFAFTSNKLAYLSEHLNKEFRKQEHSAFPGMELWNAVMDVGSPRSKLAWAEMKTYNEYDVLALEELYLKLRPWSDKHPNVNTFDDNEEMRCPICGGTHLHSRGKYHTNTGEYSRFYCVGCGAWSRTRYTENTNGKRKSLLAPGR